MGIRSRIKQITTNEVAKHSLVYVVSSLINASIPFLLLPMMTSCLTPVDYGITAMFQVVVGFLTPLVGLNVDGATSIEYYRDVHKNLKLFIGNSLIIAGVSFLLFFLLSLVFAAPLSKSIEIPSQWVVLAVVQTFLQVLVTYLLTLFQSSKQSIKYGMLQISLSAINAGLSIWLVWGLDWGYVGRLTGNLMAVGLLSVASLIYLIKKYQVEFRFDKVISTDILKFGVPLIPHMLGGWAMSLIDRVFLADMIGLEVVGLYSVAFQLASIFGFLTLAVNQAFVPWLFGRLSKDESPKTKTKIVKFSYLVMGLYLFCAALYVAVMPFIKKWFINSRYHDIDLMFDILLVGFVFQGFYYLFTNYIAFAKKTKYQAMVTIIVALVKIPTTYLFVSYWGAIGAVYSFAITFFLFFVVTAIVSQRIYPMPWSLSRN